MAEETRDVGIVVARQSLAGPWGGLRWLPIAVLPAAPPVAPWTSLGTTEAGAMFYAGASEISLYSGETSHYRDNLGGERPLLWVALRPGLAEEVEIVRVTADPYEGEALAENPGDIVEVVAMPVEIHEWVAAFFATHHVEREFFKRQRDRFDPDKMNRGRKQRGRPALPEDDE